MISLLRLIIRNKSINKFVFPAPRNRGPISDSATGSNLWAATWTQRRQTQRLVKPKDLFPDPVRHDCCRSPDSGWHHVLPEAQGKFQEAVLLDLGWSVFACACVWLKQKTKSYWPFFPECPYLSDCGFITITRSSFILLVFLRYICGHLLFFFWTTPFSLDCYLDDKYIFFIRYLPPALIFVHIHLSVAEWLSEICYMRQRLYLFSVPEGLFNKRIIMITKPNLSGFLYSFGKLF